MIGGYVIAKVGGSYEVFLLDERTVEGNFLNLQQFLMDYAFISKKVPKTKGGLMILVRFLLPFRLKEPRQLQ